MKHFISCRSIGVIYRAVCLCGLEYVCRTSREFRRSIGEHVNDIKHKRDTAIARHMWNHHPAAPLSIRFQGIDLVHRPLRKGNWDKLILQKGNKMDLPLEFSAA